MNQSTRRKRVGARQQMALGVLAIVVLIGAAVWAVRGRARPGVGGVSRADPNNREQVALGRQVYDTRCASCHGAHLAGAPNWPTPGPSGVLPATPLDATGPAWRRSDQQLFAITSAGGQAGAPAGAISAMPAFGDSLGDERIWAVLAYIKSTWPPDIRAAQDEVNRQPQ